MKDYYSILGVGRNATHDDIKKAYRKLSMKCHPDKNGGDDTQFKEINEAYSVIGDENKRKQYDMERSRGAGGVFGGFRQWQPPTNINVKISITMEEAYKGCKKTISTGTHTYNVDIPKGVTSGKILKLTGLGGGGFNMLGEYVCGDMMLFVDVQNSDKYYLDKDGTVEMMLCIDWLDAILGATMNVKFFDKKITVKIPKYSQNGGFIVVPKQGFPKFKSDECGNIKVNFIVKMPKRLTTKQIELLNRIKDNK